jgi:hypothetical protein
MIIQYGGTVMVGLVVSLAIFNSRTQETKHYSAPLNLGRLLRFTCDFQP